MPSEYVPSLEEATLDQIVEELRKRHSVVIVAVEKPCEGQENTDFDSILYRWKGKYSSALGLSMQLKRHIAYEGRPSIMDEGE